MSEQRIPTLIAAYGADPRRWPEADRGLVAQADRDALADAAALDALLAASPMPRVSASLRDRVIAQAPRLRQAFSWAAVREMFGGGYRAGWAAACAAGIVAGFALTTHVNTTAQADAVLYQASLSTTDDLEVLG